MYSLRARIALMVVSLLAAPLVVSCAVPGTPGAHSAADRHDELEWFPSAGPRERGVVVVTHGLNNDPHAMLPMIEALTRSGFTAALLTFAGHEADPCLKHSATATRWHHQLHGAYCEVAASHPGAPIYSLAYSTGAAVTVSLLDDPERYGGASCALPAIAGMFFLAPALTPRWTSDLIRPLTPLGALDLSLPSFAPARTRRHGSTSLTAYRALFDTVDAVEHLKRPALLASIPVRIELRPDDELVSSERLSAWLDDNQLDAWRVVMLPEQSEGNGYAHLLIDREAMGDAAWERLLGHVVGFFSGLADGGEAR